MKKTIQWSVGVLLTLFTISCNLGVTPTQTTSEPTEEPATLPPPPTNTSPPPTSTTDPFPNPVLKIVGEEEIVFDWTNDRCEPEHIPDLAARAFRDSSNQVQLITSHYVNYRMIGPDLYNLTSDCNPILQSDYLSDPATYDNSEWLASPYTEDGETIYALVHNEYRGHTHPGVCPTGNYFDCLDTSLTLAISIDSGKTYSEIAEPPNHLVATLPHQFEAGSGPFGHRNPSNIIKGQDGYYYSFNNVSDYKTQNQWVCLMRTNDLSDPKAWRFWNGTGFEGRFINPYTDSLDDYSDHKCEALEWENIGASLNESITYNTYLNRYVLIGISADHISGRETWGFYYAFSNDLVHWTRRKLLVEIDLPWLVENEGSDLSYLYPSLIDPDSPSRNFDTSGKTAHLYYTRMNFGSGSLDRDLIRVPVEFFPNE